MFVYYLLIGVLCVLACALIERNDLCKMLDKLENEIGEEDSKLFCTYMTIGLMIWCAITALLWPIAIIWEAVYIIRKH